VEFAPLVLDEAEYAPIDAAIAGTDADTLALNGWPPTFTTPNHARVP
jgi:hypothetical protein